MSFSGHGEVSKNAVDFANKVNNGRCHRIYNSEMFSIKPI